MIPHQVIFIHGIGDVAPGFSEDLRRRMLDSFAETVARISPQVLPEHAVECMEALWSDITQPPQDVLWNRLFPWMRDRVKPRPEELYSMRHWWSRIRYWTWLRRKIVSHQGDLIAYIEQPGANRYKRIHDRIYSSLLAGTTSVIASDATIQRPVLVTVVAHSLGSVIASDLLYDLYEHKTRWWPSQIRLANFISMGSPLALYSLRYELRMGEFQEAIRMQDEHGMWINIYDPQDVIGYPLKGLNERYDHAVSIDKEINVGQWWNLRHFFLQWNPLNHNLYWEDRRVAEIIGRKVALDWLRINRPELEPVLKDEYREYKISWIQKV